jgi:hypothetical protein
MSPKARIFISCGQRKQTDETEIAKKIADELEHMGFDPYVAVQEQTLRGVKENIFRQLANSEYFIFIDFKREKLLIDDKESGHRGSLFSHQELAIASFLDIAFVAFQEEGVKSDDGLLKFVQANCTPFSDRKALLDIVAQKVKEKGWEPTWRNEITLSRAETDLEEATTTAGPARFYHIKASNNHRDKIARNCVAYIERIKDLGTNNARTLELVELKWKGSTREAISIAPRWFRYLDAFHVNYSDLTTVHLGLNPFVVDWQGYYQNYQIRGPGDYEIDYVVFSEAFEPARARLRLHIGTRMEDLEFDVTR